MGEISLKDRLLAEGVRCHSGFLHALSEYRSLSTTPDASTVLMHTLDRNQYWLNYLSPFYPVRRARLYSGLLALAWHNFKLSEAFVGWPREHKILCLSVSFFCLSNKYMSFKSSWSWVTAILFFGVFFFLGDATLSFLMLTPSSTVYMRFILEAVRDRALPSALLLPKCPQSTRLWSEVRARTSIQFSLTL